MTRAESSGRNRVVRYLLIIVGTVSVALGLVGIFVPLLPTTPFLLLAGACFVRSSDRLYRALYSHRWTGPYLQRYQSGQGMPMRAKITTVAILWGTLAISAFLVQNIWVWALLAAVAVGVPLFIASLPTFRD